MKFDDVLKYVYEEKDTLATMKSSHERFGAYPEVNGGSPVDGTLNDTITTLNAELAEQAKTPTTIVTAYKVPSQKLFIWGDDELPKEIVTTRNSTYVTPP